MVGGASFAGTPAGGMIAGLGGEVGSWPWTTPRPMKARARPLRQNRFFMPSSPFRTVSPPDPNMGWRDIIPVILRTMKVLELTGRWVLTEIRFVTIGWFA